MQSTNQALYMNVVFFKVSPQLLEEEREQRRMQTLGNCNNLLVTSSATSGFLLEHPLCDQFSTSIN